MKIYLKDEEIEIAVKKRITPKLKVQFNELYSKLKEYKSDVLLREGLEGIEYQMIGGEYTTKVTDPKAAAKIMEAQKAPLEQDILIENTNTYIELIKLILEPFTQEIDWQEQDINAIIAEVRSFRTGIIA